MAFSRDFVVIRDSLTLSALLFALLGMHLPAIAGEVPLSALILSGQTADGVAIRALDEARLSLNDAGDVAVIARGAGLSSAIFRTRAGVLELVAQSDFEASEAGANRFFGSVSTPILNDAGQVVFSALLYEKPRPSTGDEIDSLWLADSSGRALLFQTGDQVPNGPVFDVFHNDTVRLNNNGSIFFGAIDGDREQALWRASSSHDVSLVVRQGQTAPGMSEPFADSGSRFFLRGDLDDGNRVLFEGQTAPLRLNHGIFLSDTDGTLSSVVVPGDSFETPPGAIVDVRGPRELVINAKGRVAFTAHLGNFVYGVYTNRFGAIENLALSGQTPSELPGGESFSAFVISDLTDSGGLFWQSTLAGPNVGTANDKAIWYTDPDSNTRLVVREGDVAPNTNGMVFKSISGGQGNDSGQFLFAASLQETPDSLFHGFWGFDPSVGLFEIARSGDELVVAPGDVRTIIDLGYAAFTAHVSSPDGTNGGPRIINNAHQAVFHAGFSDGSSAVLLADLTIVPEPSTLTLIALGTLSLLGFARGRRRRAA